MALTADTNWHIRISGADTNAGGVDFTLMSFTNVAQTLSLSAASGSGITATAGGGTPFASGDVGKFIKENGTGSYALITGFTSSTVVTMTVLTNYGGFSPSAVTTPITSNGWSMSSGINYANQNSPQVTFSSGNSNRLNCSDHTGTGGTNFVVTSDGTPFTAAMVGSCIRINSGTNFTAGYYFIKTFTSSSSVKVDRDPTNGSNGSVGAGVLGGAFASPNPLATTCAAGAPTITSPLAAGHVVYVEDSGSASPTVATYSSWSTGYTFPAGSPTTAATGLIKFLPMSMRNRFRIDCAGNLAIVSGHLWQGLYQFSTATGSGTFMFFNPQDGSGKNCYLYDCVFDQNGYGCGGTTITNVIGCAFINSNEGGHVAGVCREATGGTSGEPAGTYYGRIQGCVFIGWKSIGSVITHPNWLHIDNNVFINCDAQYIMDNGTAQYSSSFMNNTIYNPTGGGVRLWHDCLLFSSYVIRNNIFANIPGIALVFDPTDDSSTPARFNLPPDYNAFYSCGTNYSGVTPGPHDVALGATPFMDAVGLDFRLNTNTPGGAQISAAGWPASYFGTNI